MQSYSAIDLIFPSLCIFLAAIISMMGALRRAYLVITFALMKSSIYFLYFSLFFDGSYTFLDDWSYVEGGELINQRGLTIGSLFDQIEYAKAIAGGDHYIYYLYNAYAMQLFGSGYYAPVALNVILTTIVARIGYWISLKNLNLEKDNADNFFIFVLFHPDILSWSTIVNCKDVLVLTLHSFSILGISLIYRKNLIVGAPLLISSLLLMNGTRFYAAPLIICSLIIAFFVRDRRIMFIALILLVPLLYQFAPLFVPWVSERVGNFRSYELSSSIGIFRMLVTPIPFMADAGYEFLNFSSLINIILLPLFIVGFYRMTFSNNELCRFLALYVFIFIVFYGTNYELQGPRQRVQLDLAWAIFQYVGALTIFSPFSLKALEVVTHQKAPMKQ